MDTKTIEAELRGGPLDGAKRKVDRDSPPCKLIARNPNPITYHSKLCQPLVLRNVCYCLVFKTDDLLIYAFEGHVE